MIRFIPDEGRETFEVIIGSTSYGVTEAVLYGDHIALKHPFGHPAQYSGAPHGDSHWSCLWKGDGAWLIGVKPGIVNGRPEEKSE